MPQFEVPTLISNASPIMPPRVLLLLENSGTGGVTTIAKTLGLALRQEGWIVTSITLGSSWKTRIAAVRACDVVIAANNFRPAYVAWLLGFGLRKPVIVWVHGPVQEVLEQANTHRIKRLWLRWFYARCRRLVFVSRSSRESFMSFVRNRHWPTQCSPVIHNAVALSDAHFSLPEKSRLSSCHIAFVGRLSVEKRPQLALDVLRLLPASYQLTFVGDGPERSALERAGHDLVAQGRLHFAGHQTISRDLYRQFDLTLLTSRYEGCPMAALESLAAGVPCVAPPIPSAAEMLSPQAECLLAPNESAQALAEAVQRAARLPEEILAPAIQGVLNRYRLYDFVRQWQNVLKKASSHAD